MLSGCLAQPQPPSGGKPEERGAEENATQSLATFKAQVALAAVKADKTLADLSEQFHVYPTQITQWKQQLLTRATDVFGGTTPKLDAPVLTVLHATIGDTRVRRHQERAPRKDSRFLALSIHGCGTRD